MKRCPVCNRSYTDKTLNFCLVDGTPLVAQTTENLNANLPTLSLSEAPTEVLPAGETASNKAAPTLASQQSPATATPPPQFAPPIYPAPYSPPANNKRKLLLWILVGVLLIVAGVEAYLLLGRGAKEDQGSERVSVNSSNQMNVNTHASGTTSPLPTAAPLPKQTPTLSPSPTQTPSTPTPTPTPNTTAARSEVMAVMNSWAESLRRQDLSANLRLYADHLDAYYQLGSASREQVRANRQAIFNRYYSSTDVRLSNISIEIDSAGTRATVSYDNAYDWKGGSKYLTGKSHNQMTLTRSGSQWLITSEKHLQTYYETSGN